MADVARMRVNFRRVPSNSNVFEFTITTPLLRAQFRLPRPLVNQLRVELERALIKK